MGFKVPKDSVCNVASVYLTQITQGHLFPLSIKHSVVKLCDSALLGFPPHFKHLTQPRSSEFTKTFYVHLFGLGSIHNHFKGTKPVLLFKMKVILFYDSYLLPVSLCSCQGVLTWKVLSCTKQDENQSKLQQACCK